MLSGQELTMRTIREILRLGLSSGLSMREIGLSLRVRHPTAKKYIEAVRAAGLEWPQVEATSDEALRQVVIKIETNSTDGIRCPLPDYMLVHPELKKPGVTLDLRNTQFVVENYLFTPEAERVFVFTTPAASL